MFQRLGSALLGELRRLEPPRAARLGFALAVLTYNALSALERSLEQAHHDDGKPALEVSTHRLAANLRSRYEGMVIAQGLLELACHHNLRAVSTAKRSPKIDRPKGCRCCHCPISCL